MSSPFEVRCLHRRLVEGTSTVPAAPPIKYILGYRSGTRTLTYN